jgi:nucleoside-triphosphatase THEP1/energy-coupling factor transporter transmembrane protein EcfT
VRRVAGVFLAASVVALLFADPVYAVWVVPVAIAAAWFLDPPALRAGLRVGVMLAIVFAAAVTAAVVAWAEGPERGFATGGMVLLRLAVLVVTAGVLVRSFDAERLLVVAQRLGLERLGLVLGLALNTLPRLVEASAEVWTASRVRGDGAVARLRRLPGLGEVLLAHTARIAEEAAAAASLRGHSALTRPARMLVAPVRVVVVTGPSNGGKTGTVIAAAERLRSGGVPVAGFVQPGEFEAGSKVGFRLRDLASGGEATLAIERGRGEGDFGTRFHFTDEGFALGRGALSRAAPGAVVIVDELGPVELRGHGHMPAVRRALAVPGLLGAIIVVRRNLVPALLAELEASDATVIDVEDHGAGSIDAIIGALGADLKID